MTTSPKIVLHKEIQTDSTYVPSFTLKLTVSETEGGITPCIFIHEFNPKNPATGKVTYDFTNVAYYDELTEVKDYVVDKNHAGLVRRSAIIKSFADYDSLTSFLSTVTRDVQRLLQQLGSVHSTDNCENIIITENGAVIEPCAGSIYTDCTEPSNTNSDNSKTEAIVLTFDGEIS